VSASTTGTVVAQSAFKRTRVVVSYQGVSDTAWVSVVPLFPMVGNGGRIRLINTDGSGATTLATFDEWLTSPSSVAATPSVVFQRQGFSNFGLGVVEPNGTPRPLLGAWSADDNWPRLSPDGAWVYFVRAGATLWRVKLDGTGLDSLTSFVPQGRYHAPTISPDGSSVAIEDGTGIQIVDVATKAKRMLPVTCPAPRYSPDGTRFACLTLSTVSVMAIDGTGQRVVTRFLAPGTDDVTGVDWSPDGKWLVVATANVLGNAVLIDVATGEQLPLRAVAPQSSFVR
jgi:dipeptidyl aminopeptidase/acylaminoacyl peptidase